MKYFAEPSFHDSGSIAGLAPLLQDALSGADLAPLANQWIERARSSRSANTLLDLSIVLELLRKRELALAIQADALKLSQHFRVSSFTAEHALKLLVLKTPGDLSTNTPVECLVHHSDIEVELFYVGPGLPLPEAPPEHDLLLVAIAESNENRLSLEHLHRRLATWPRPQINAPEEILKLERTRACSLLSPIPNIEMPPTKQVSRETVRRLATFKPKIEDVLDGGAYPIIIRPVDSHAGRGLVKIESPTELLKYLDDRSDAEFFLSQFIDYRSPDGLFRKYRIVIMQGRPFLCHMGISEHWMVHYPYEEMISNLSRREEEKQSMATFDEGFARRHQSALSAIHKQIHLDYFGLDCAQSRDGRLLIFEAASAMLVHAMDSPESFPYKQAQMRKVFGAFRSMLGSISLGKYPRRDCGVAQAIAGFTDFKPAEISRRVSS